MTDGRPLVLSCFPGIGLLDKAFEEEGFCVVRGPDCLWGGDIHRFSPPAGVFAGVIGGPPCQAFSVLRYLNPACGQKHGNLIPEFERVVSEAQPDWFVMENVPAAPEPVVSGYVVRAQRLNNRWFPGADGSVGAEQNRTRRVSFGTRDGRVLPLDVAPLEAPAALRAVTGAEGGCSPSAYYAAKEYAVTSSAAPGSVRLIRDGHGGHRLKTALRRPPSVVADHSPVQAAPGEQRTVLGVPSADGAGHSNMPDEPRYSLAEMCRLQGLPEDFADELPFTMHGKRLVIGNGVPLPMGRAIARAVRRAMGYPPMTDVTPATSTTTTQ